MTSAQVWPTTSTFPLGTTNPTRFQLVFPTLPFLEMFCNVVTLPDVNLGMITHSTRLLDLKQPGEKLNFDTLHCQFLFDNEMKNYKEIFSWMKRISVQGLHASDRVPVRLLTDTGVFIFDKVFPISIGSTRWDSTATDIQTLSCDVVFAYDQFYPE